MIRSAPQLAQGAPVPALLAQGAPAPTRRRGRRTCQLDRHQLGGAARNRPAGIRVPSEEGR
jgi:hypothetical protein